jgi:hypothetical protein
VCSNLELLREKQQKHRIVISFCYCLLAITFIFKILKKFGQAAILSTQEEILVAFLAFE